MLSAWITSSGISGGEVGNGCDIPGINIGGGKLAEVLLLVVDEVLSAENEMNSSWTYKQRSRHT